MHFHNIFTWPYLTKGMRALARMGLREYDSISAKESQFVIYTLHNSCEIF